MPKVADLPTPEQRREATEPARVAARFHYARERCKKIVSTWPPLTPEMKAELACILLTPGDGDAT